jgi:hypothetical protein
LNQCLARSTAEHDRAISNAYLAKAALRLGSPQRARELLDFATAKGSDHPLVQRIVEELKPQLQSAGVTGTGTGPVAS